MSSWHRRDRQWNDDGDRNDADIRRRQLHDRRVAARAENPQRYARQEGGPPMDPPVSKKTADFQDADRRYYVVTRDRERSLDRVHLFCKGSSGSRTSHNLRSDEKIRLYPLNGMLEALGSDEPVTARVVWYMPYRAKGSSGSLQLDLRGTTVTKEHIAPRDERKRARDPLDEEEEEEPQPKRAKHPLEQDTRTVILKRRDDHSS